MLPMVQVGSRREFLQVGGGALVAGHLTVTGSAQPAPAPN